MRDFILDFLIERNTHENSFWQNILKAFYEVSNENPKFIGEFFVEFEWICNGC